MKFIFDVFLIKRFILYPICVLILQGKKDSFQTVNSTKDADIMIPRVWTAECAFHANNKIGSSSIVGTN